MFIKEKNATRRPESLFDQVGRTHSFFSSSSLCSVAYKLSIDHHRSVFLIFFLLLSHVFCLCTPSPGIPSPPSYSNCSSSSWSPSPLLTAQLTSYFLNAKVLQGKGSAPRGACVALRTQYLHVKDCLPLFSLSQPKPGHSSITQRAFGSVIMGQLMNLLLQLGWSPKTSVCGGSSLQGREDTQFWIECSVSKRKVTH